MQTTRYVLRFEPYVPAFTQKVFTMSTQNLPQREPPPRNLKLQSWSIQLLSPTQPPLLKKDRQKAKYNHLYTRGIGIKPNNNHLYTRGTRHKVKPQS